MKHDLSQDFFGASYDVVISRLHEVLKPQSYLEIGVCHGHTLQFSKSETIAIDPRFDFNDMNAVRNFTTNKKALLLFQMTSDSFFAKYSPTALFGRPIDIAFLDGMHRSEYLLRDFINTERHCRQNSIVILHDCLPLELGMTSRVVATEAIAPHRAGWWTGDVWKTALLLKRERPDLHITAIDAPPTGLVVITNLDPKNSNLENNYNNLISKMEAWDLSEIGIESLFNEMMLQSTSAFTGEDDITRRYWL